LRRACGTTRERGIGQQIDAEGKAGKLAKGARAPGTNRGTTRVAKKPDLTLAARGVDKSTQRIGAMPEAELEKAIGEEIKKVPKASGRPAKILTTGGKNKSSRAGTGIPGTSRSRLQKLAAIPIATLKAKSKELRAAGKDATVNAVIRAAPMRLPSNAKVAGAPPLFVARERCTKLFQAIETKMVSRRSQGDARKKENRDQGFLSVREAEHRAPLQARAGRLCASQ
jgi:hypothetical protein